MPSSREIRVERVVNGVRDLRFSEEVPAGLNMVVEQADDHTHIVLGTDDELLAVGAKEAPKKSTPKKSMAKKSTAKKSTAKKAT